MKKLMKITMVGVTLVLASCGFSGIEKGLSKARGRPVEGLFDAMGYPNKKYKINDKTIYVWSSAHQETLYHHNVERSHGYIDNTPFTMNTSSLDPYTAQMSCKIKVVVDLQGNVESADYIGNPGGCAGYNKMLKNYANSQ